MNEAPALICRKCEKHVMQANELKKLCIKSEKYFKKSLNNENYLWHENIRDLKASMKTEMKHVTEAEKAVMSEPAPTSTDATHQLTDLNEHDLEELQKDIENNLFMMTDIDHNDTVTVLKSHKAVSLNGEEVSDTFEIKKEPIDDEEACNKGADTEPCGETLKERLETDFDFVDKITYEQIEEMTNLITVVLPCDTNQVEENLKKSKKNHKLIKLNIKAKRSNKPNNKKPAKLIKLTIDEPKPRKNDHKTEPTQLRRSTTQLRRSKRRGSLLFLKKSI